MFQACPDFKGIKTLVLGLILHGVLFQACPDFKGIKTASLSTFAEILFQACPDFKGIKTAWVWSELSTLVAFQACPDFKGIKTAGLKQMTNRAHVSSLP